MAIKNVKIFFFFFGIAAFLFLNNSKLSACEIEISIVGEKKASYKVDEEFVAKVKVVLTHRNCPEGIEATKFQTKGLKVIGQTRWEESSPGVFQRKLKIKVTSADDGKAVLNVVRKCDKEGGFGSLTIKTSSK